MKSETEAAEFPMASQASTLAKCLAPEDICIGDYVTVLYSSQEFPLFLWNSIPSTETLRVSFIPSAGGVPERVQAICLPFVFVKHPDGSVRSLDTRVCQIALLSTAYAAISWKEHRRQYKKLNRPPGRFAAPQRKKKFKPKR